MQLLMRRPQIDEFVSIAAPANRFDFSFLEPCPPSDLFIHGDLGRVAPLKEVIEQIDELKTYKDAVIENAVVPGANHFFEDRLEPLILEVGAYLDKRLGEPARIAIPARAKGRRDRFRAEPTGDGSIRAGGAWRLEVGGVCRRFCQTPKFGALYSLGELASCINSLKTATKDRCRRALKEEEDHEPHQGDQLWHARVQPVWKRIDLLK